MVPIIAMKIPEVMDVSDRKDNNHYLDRNTDERRIQMFVIMSALFVCSRTL